MLLTWTCFQRVAILFHVFFISIPVVLSYFRPVLLRLLLPSWSFCSCSVLKWDCDHKTSTQDHTSTMLCSSIALQNVRRRRMDWTSFLEGRWSSSVENLQWYLPYLGKRRCEFAVFIRSNPSSCFSKQSVKIHMFGAVAVLLYHGMWCGQLLKNQEKEVFMANPVPLLIQYGDLLVWNGDHSFAICFKKIEVRFNSS